MNTKQYILLTVFVVAFLITPWVILGYTVNFSGADGNGGSVFPPLRSSEKWFDLVWETPSGQLANILLVIQDSCLCNNYCILQIACTKTNEIEVSIPESL